MTAIWRHWRGEFSLARSFWANYVLVGSVYGVLVVQISIIPDRMGLPGLGGLLFLILLPPGYIWAIVGTWRAADHAHSFWGVVTKLYLIVFITAEIITLTLIVSGVIK
jgi:hypothetical protein